ncbi:DUF2157 domain-containing protein [Sphaerisporangium sp. NPDC005288]|uniref:DUF2157 domain-containing protein n=1 Tax=Sphaerisporangium sp. NPDC005288 TaxID=3155114 RepID=UPI0033A4E31A
MEPTWVRVPARRLAWLRGELARWQAEGVIDATAAERIAGRYVPGRRLSLERVVLLLGGGFLGVGLIWVVAANLDQLSPLARFAGITVVWLAAAVLGEALAGPAVRSAARLVAVLAAGGVVFQAAQSLQVPAYGSGLLGVWAAGALAYAYATHAAGPLLAALVLGASWYGWWAGEQTDSAGGVAVCLVAAGTTAISLAVLHERLRTRAGAIAGPDGAGGTQEGSAGDGETQDGPVRAGGAVTGGPVPAGIVRDVGAPSPWSGRFAAVWRAAGFLLALGGLFVAAFPGVSQGEMYGAPALWAGLTAAAVAAGAALVLGGAGDRREAAAAQVFGGAGDRREPAAAQVLGGAGDGREAAAAQVLGGAQDRREMLARRVLGGAGHRYEVLAALVMVVAAVSLVAWAPGDAEPAMGGFTAAQTARAVAGTLLYILAASWFAVAAARRDETHLVLIATVALVVFVTAQSFAVFQPLLSGAALFLALGVIFIVTGALVEYGRRRLMEATR